MAEEKKESEAKDAPDGPFVGDVHRVLSSLDLDLLNEGPREDYRSRILKDL